jgi:hypothetical protein
MCILFSQTFSDARLWLIVPHREKNGKSSLATGLPFGNSLVLSRRLSRSKESNTAGIGTRLMLVIFVQSSCRLKSSTWVTVSPPPWLFPVHFEHVGGDFAGLVVDSVSTSWTLR